MTPYLYSRSIQIQFVRGKTLATAADIGDTDAKSFKKFIVGALDALKKSNTGAQLLHEINNSGHSMIIFAGGEHDDNAALANPANTANGIARMAVNFRPFQKNLPMSAKSQKVIRDGKGNIRTDQDALNMVQAYRDMVEDRRQVGLQAGLPTTPAEGGKEFHKICRRVVAAGAQAQFRRALEATGMTMDDVRNACLGTRKFSDAEYYKLCFYLYDFLTPGPGCATQVRMQFRTKFRAGFKDEYTAAKKSWFGTDDKAWNKVAAVILGHELVHAWRMMVGRRIVDDGYDEEIMTVGCGPFANFPFTENAIRRDLRLRGRSGYQPLSRYYSDIASQMVNDPNAMIEAI